MSTAAISPPWLRYIPAVAALRTYTVADLRADVVAGVTVATVAVPQAMAYALVAGVPAEVGLTTAIVMTAVGAVFDSSRRLINGPTNAISIALLSALALLPADQKLVGVVTLALLVGSFQTIITLLRLGDLTRYISHSVIVGFTFGASVLLVLDQVKNIMGWSAKGDPHDNFLHRLWLTWSAGGAPHGPTLAIGLGTMAAVIALRWMKQRLGWLLFPEFLVVISAMAGITGLFGLDAQGVKVVGDVPAAFPSFSVPNITWENVELLWSNALAVAVLGLLEAIAMSKALAAQTGEKVDLNQQCLSEGLANLTVSFFGGMPGSGSLTRSAINQQAGAMTQWAGVFCAGAVAVIVLMFGPFARLIPKAALAGMLIVSSYRMIDWPALRRTLRATQFDAIIVAATAISAVAISVEFCILIGVVMSALLTVPRAGRMTRTEFVVEDDGVVHELKEGEPSRGVPILIFGLEGELFFGSSIALDEHLDAIAEAASHGTRVVVLMVKRLRNPDAVGLHELASFLQHMHKQGVRVLLSGVSPELHKGLKRDGVLGELAAEQVFPESKKRGSSTIEAIASARRFIGIEGGAEAVHFMV